MRTGATGESATELRQGQHGCWFMAASLPPVLPSEPLDNHKIALSDKLCEYNAKISALLGVLPQNLMPRTVLEERLEESLILFLRLTGANMDLR